MLYDPDVIQKNIKANPNSRKVVLTNEQITPLLIKALRLNGVPYSKKFHDDEHTELSFNVSRISRAMSILGRHINFQNKTIFEILMDQ